MLKLEEVKAAIDHLSLEDLRELREHLGKRTGETLGQPQLPPKERIHRLDEAAKAICEGFTEAEWEAVERAMNEEYIDPEDESEWTD